MPLLIGSFILLIAGIILKLFPPKKINSLYGWRSNYAQKNQEIWDEAQRYGAKQLMYGGVFGIIVGYIIPYIFEKHSTDIAGIGFLVLVGVVFFRGEHYLRKKFDKEGNRIED